MNTNRSLLQTIIDRIRLTLDEGSTGKFTDPTLSTHIIPSSIENVMSRLMMDMDNPIITSFSITTVANQSRYRLPSHMSSIKRVVRKDARGRIIAEIIPHSNLSVYGPGWAIEGNELVFDPKPSVGETWYILMETGSLVSPHYATDGTLNADLDTITLSEDPALGLLDYSDGGYLGQMVRVIDTSNRRVESAVISSQSYDTGTATVTLNRPLTDISSGTVTYEILPLMTNAILDAVVYDACMTIALSREKSNNFVGLLRRRYQSAIKSAGDRLTNLQGRVPKGGQKFSVDRNFSPLDTGAWLWGVL
jgi:hypothetical protein